MATYQTRPDWEAAQGGLTAVSFAGTPTGSNPASYADAATLDNCLLAGFKVNDPGGLLTGVTDDGSKMVVVMNDEVTNQRRTASKFFITNPTFYWPEFIVGDFDFIAKVGSLSSGNSQRQVGLCCAGGDTLNETGFITAVFGANSSANGTYSANSFGNGSFKNANGSAGAWATARWLRIARVKDVISYYEGGTGASPSWSLIGVAEKWDRSGGASQIGIVWHGETNGDTLHLYDVQLTGSVYPTP